MLANLGGRPLHVVLLNDGVRLCLPQVLVKGPAPTTVMPGATREGLHTFTYCARSTGDDPANVACSYASRLLALPNHEAGANCRTVAADAADVRAIRRLHHLSNDRRPAHERLTGRGGGVHSAGARAPLRGGGRPADAAHHSRYMHL